MNNSDNESFQKGLTRRGFMKGAIAAGAAVTLSDKLAMATKMISGKAPTIEGVRGVGVDPGLVRMSLNENPLGPSPRAVEAIADRMFGVNRYGTELGDLLQALSEFDEVELPKRDPNRSFFRSPPGPFILSSGSSQILGLLSLAYLSREGGEVVEAEFGYGQLSRAGSFYKEIFGVDVNVIKATMTKGYKHDLDVMADLITEKTSLAVITNPNNPTGTLLQTEEMDQFITKIPSSVVVVIDEAYLHFAEQDPIPSAIPLALKYDNVIVVRTFSKAYAMAALRLGYGVASQKIQTELRKYSTGGPNVLASVAGAAAVRDLDHLQKSREVVWQFKHRLYEEFDKMGLEYIPSQGTFIMVNINRSSRAVVTEMRKRKVSVSSRRQDEFKNWIRISAGTHYETEVFLKTLKDVLSKAS